MAESLAELVRSYRSTAGMSQELLAERAGLSGRTIGDIETGFQRSPRLITVMLIAQALALGDADCARLRASIPKRGTKERSAGVPVKGPLPRIHLLGRDREVAEISAALARDGARLLTITGPAGVGKTSLAIRIASLSTQAFDGVTFVSLAPLSDPDLVPSAIAAELGIAERADVPFARALAGHLQDARHLLVLDNFEHVLPGAAFLGELLTACPDLKALVTSRERLHLREERGYALQPLEESAGVSLFVERARAVSFDFALSEANEPVLKAIVERLEGLPLAIELAAPRLTLLTPQALLARLERRLPLLEGGSVDLPERQQTMRNAIEWSYDLLADREQHLFRSMALFSGGATIEAARDVSGESPAEILGVLAALVEKSLLSLVEDDDGEPRIGMLELLREFALDRLMQMDEASGAQERMAKYFLNFAVAAQAELKGAEQARWLTRIQREHANIRAVLEWTLHGGDLETGLRVCGAMWRFWWMRGYFTEGYSWSDRLLARIRTAPNGVSPFAEAKALQGKVMLMGALGDFEEALAPCERAIALWREIGDEAELSVSLNSLGIVLLMTARFEEARRTHEEALAIRRQIGDRFGVATSLGSLASVAQAQSDSAAAIAACEESIDIFRSLQSDSALSISLTKLGSVLQETGDFERANQMFEESLELQLRMDDKANILYSYDRLALVALKLGRYETARERWRQAFELLETVTNKSLTAEALDGMMALLIHDGDFKKAARLCGASNALREAIHCPKWPYQLAEYEEQVRAMRESLGERGFSEEYRFGSTAPLRRIVNDAFAVTA